MERKFEFIRRWLPLTAAAVSASILLGTILHIPLIQSLTAGGLTAVLVLTGFFFRAHGRGEDHNSENGTKSNLD